MVAVGLLTNCICRDRVEQKEALGMRISEESNCDGIVSSSSCSGRLHQHLAIHELDREDDDMLVTVLPHGSG